jgi:hypothetical protein
MFDPEKVETLTAATICSSYGERATFVKASDYDQLLQLYREPQLIAMRHLLKRMYDECGPEAWQKFCDRVNSGEHDAPSPWSNS